MHIDVDADSSIDTKGAYVEGVEHLAVKIASGFFRNPGIGLPSCSSMMALVNARTGQFDCVFLDNGYLMDLRTGLAGAIAAKHLSLRNVDTVGVIGTGVQARYQIESLALVRSFRRVMVYGRDAGRVSAYCAEMAERLEISVEPATGIEDLVRASQIVVTTTQATAPLVSTKWLHPGPRATARSPGPKSPISARRRACTPNSSMPKACALDAPGSRLGIAGAITGLASGGADPRDCHDRSGCPNYAPGLLRTSTR